MIFFKTLHNGVIHWSWYRKWNVKLIIAYPPRVEGTKPVNSTSSAWKLITRTAASTKFRHWSWPKSSASMPKSGLMWVNQKLWCWASRKNLTSQILRSSCKIHSLRLQSIAAKSVMQHRNENKYGENIYYFYRCLWWFN